MLARRRYQTPTHAQPRSTNTGLLSLVRSDLPSLLRGAQNPRRVRRFLFARPPSQPRWYHTCHAPLTTKLQQPCLFQDQSPREPGATSASFSFPFARSKKKKKRRKKDARMHRADLPSPPPPSPLPSPLREKRRFLGETSFNSLTPSEMILPRRVEFFFLSFSFRTDSRFDSPIDSRFLSFQFQSWIYSTVLFLLYTRILIEG